MIYKSVNIMDQPFRSRLRCCDEICAARQEERHLSTQGRMKHKYDYDREPFGVRKKEFYELHQARKVS